MSICNPCVKTKPISLCADELIVGKVKEANTTYNVWFKSLSNGAFYGYKVISDSNKLLTIKFDAGFPLANNHAYEMWVNKPSDSIGTQLEVTSGPRIAYCFLVQSVRTEPLIYGYLDPIQPQTLEIQ